MDLEFQPPTEIEKQRSAWFDERAKPGMTLDECLLLSDEARQLFPITEEERLRKFESLKNMPEFVL